MKILGSSPHVYFHGTKAELEPGDTIDSKVASYYRNGKNGSFVYLTATLDTAIWDAELSLGDGLGRIYEVEPIGSISEDPNLTNRTLGGNPTKSFRSRDPLRVIREVTGWIGHPAEMVQTMKRYISTLEQLGIDAYID